MANIKSAKKKTRVIKRKTPLTELELENTRALYQK